MTDPYRKLEIDRLRERIAVLERDRAGLMASIRHMRRGRLDSSYITEPLRAELARAPSYGVLLETIEVEIRCLRECLADLEEASEPEAPARAMGRWQEIDRRLNLGEFDPEEVAETAIEAGLARRVLGPGTPEGLREVWVIEPARSQLLVPGPMLMIAFTDELYGGPRLYRPVSDKRRFDTGAFS